MSDLEIDETVKVLISMKRSDRDLIDSESERLKVPRSKFIVFAVKQWLDMKMKIKNLTVDGRRG